MQQMVLISIEDLRSTIINCVDVCLKHNNLQAQSSKQEENDILDIKAAADLLKYSVPSMYRLCGNNQIPNFKKGKKILFSKKELTEWAKTGRRKTLAEFDQTADNFLQGAKK